MPSRERYPHPDHVRVTGPGHTTGIDQEPADPPHGPMCSVCHVGRGVHSGRIAITTRYLPATDTHGSRVVAEAKGNTLADGTPARTVVPYDDDETDPYLLAALQLADRARWGADVELYGGATEDGVVFTLLPRGGIAALERVAR